MAAFLPGAPCRIVAANPGACLFPTRDLPFPYGFGGLPQNLCDDDAMRAYLAAPLTLYLGTGDTVQDKEFEKSPLAMKQGSTRLERGRACFEMARMLAAKKQWPCMPALFLRAERPVEGHRTFKLDFPAVVRGAAGFGGRGTLMPFGAFMID